MKEAVQKIAFSFYPEDLSRLEEIAADTGMKKTEIMRQLIKKCHRDQKEREIITKESYWDKCQRRKVATSYNVQCDEQPKKDAGVHTPASVDSSINQEHDKPIWEEDKDFLRYCKDATIPASENSWKEYQEAINDPEYLEYCKKNNLNPKIHDNEWKFLEDKIEALYK